MKKCYAVQFRYDDKKYSLEEDEKTGFCIYVYANSFSECVSYLDREVSNLKSYKECKIARIEEQYWIKDVFIT